MTRIKNMINNLLKQQQLSILNTITVSMKPASRKHTRVNNPHTDDWKKFKRVLLPYLLYTINISRVMGCSNLSNLLDIFIWIDSTAVAFYPNIQELHWLYTESHQNKNLNSFFSKQTMLGSVNTLSFITYGWCIISNIKV